MRRARRRGIEYDSCRLDAQQVEAVVACEDAQLVLASAGSGKTLSLLAKIEYINAKLGIPPSQILAISFTKKTVEELRERCKVLGVDFRTFHSLGNYLLQQGDNALGTKSLIDDTELKEFTQTAIAELCSRDENFARALNDFILFDLSTPHSPGSLNSFAAKIAFQRLSLRTSLKHELLRKRHEAQPKAADFRSQLIRSKAEQLIADWLFIHGLDYEYKKPFPLAENYRPHFTISDVYLDVLEIGRSGESIYGGAYVKDAKWRANLHRKHRTKYIVLHTWRWDDDSVYSYLEQKLQECGLAPKRLPESGIAQLIHAHRDAEWQDFLGLLRNFLSLHKNGAEKLSVLRNKFKSLPTLFECHRASRFLQLYTAYYLGYEQYLFELRKYDFADMINLATRNVREISGCARGYRYILLDEVQDLSRNRQLLVREILRKNDGCKLFAVGDDWQSIYRFTGSNLELIRNFAQVFELPTRRGLIETTHRFAAPTVTISSDFVQKNPVQARKHIHTDKSGLTPIEIIFNEPDEAIRGSDAPAFRRALTHLLSQYGYEELQKKSLQIISRYNHDFVRLDNADDIEATEDKIIWHTDSMELSFDFCSMHKSKGITRDIVIVLNMNSDLMGMPARRETEPIIDCLLSRDEDYPFAEERRLFYVAITRARERTILLANRKNPSPFLFEICEELSREEGYLCPKCESGELLHKITKRGAITYCSNFAYGCDYFKRE